MLVALINFIAIRFNFNLDTPDIYIYQLKQNNNRDIYALFNLLLPFIDDMEGSFYLHKQIYDLADISTKKVNNNKLSKGFVERSKEPHLDNITKNPYLITNLEYNRSNKSIDYLSDITKTEISEEAKFTYKEYNSNDENDKNKYFKEYSFCIDDVLNNFYLLLNSIDQISNKLYINWINIRPIIDYKNSNLYKKTFKYNKEDGLLYIDINKKKVKFGWYNPIPKYLSGFPDKELVSNDDLKEYQGLSCGDIYNMIHHELYFGVKDYKWFIYELPKNKNYVDMYTYWDLLKYHFNKIEEFIKNNLSYEDIINNYFSTINEWNNKKNELKNLINNDDDENKKLIYNILYFLQRKYSNRFELESSKYIDLKIREKKLNEDTVLDKIEETDNYKINNSDIIESWDSLDMKYIYNYIFETYNKFKKTWYGYNLLTLDKKYPFKSEDNIINPISHTVSYKNIYNFSKSIILSTYITDEKRTFDILALNHYRKYNWHVLGTYNEKDKDEIINKYGTDLILHKYLFIDAMNVTEDEIQRIFNINRILGLMYPNLGNKQKLSNLIFNKIRKNIVDIVFECLFIRGTLNEYIPDKECTDKKLLSTDYNTSISRRIAAIKKNIFNNENLEGYKKCYYYLTGDPYDNLPLIIKKNEKPVSYFEALEKGTWYTFYAMDWISQIGFYHRYINNRVLYITGATGAGKSSQVPKLLLYGLKMIEFNGEGKVVSTQPRISPTVSNAEEISEQMGVSISNYSQTVDSNIKTFMTYVQYKTMKNSHLGEDQDYYFKEMTDGSLVTELYKNPLLKKMIKKDKNNIFDDKLEFGLTNVYDIVIIDESHEHNKYMDIILTLMKYATFWNNSLKLVIISATMVEDEPIYRRYYRDINDNMMYPLSLHNMNSSFNGFNINNKNEVYLLDRLTVDRRIHISPPGETTQHKVVDVYLDIDTKDYLEAEEKGIKKVFELIDTKSQGDILFFTLGSAQIKKIVEELNGKTPSHVIALPFYSELPEYWKDLGEKTFKIKYFTTNKKDLFKEINSKGSGAKVPPGTYTQVIVVATNVAEASITIVNLRHVIETGYFNSITYNSLTKMTDAAVAPIAEANRIQRRGRVGRIAGGTVWYMYKRGTREDIKPSYSICVSDIKDDIFSILRKKSNEPLLIDDKYNIYKIFSKNIYYKYSNDTNEDFLKKFIMNINEDTELNTLSFIKYFKEDPSKIFELSVPNKDDIFKETKESVNKMVEEQYMFHLFNNIKYSIVYLGNSKNIEKITMIDNWLYKPHNRYMTGYNLSSLIDIYGTFHLIHPAENLCYRHMITGIIDNSYNNSIGKFNSDYIKKSVSNIATLFYSRMIIPKKPKIRTDISLLSFSKKKLLKYRSTTDNSLTGIHKIFIDDSNNSNSTNDMYDKTVFAYKFKAVYDKLDLSNVELKDENLKRGCIIALIYGILFDIPLEICKTISALLVFGSEMKSFIPQDIVNGKPRFNLNKNPLNQFKNNYGDIITLYNVFNKFYSDFKHLNFWTILNANDIQKYDVNYNIDRNEYNNIKKEINSKILKKDNSVWDCLKNDKINYADFLILQKIDQKNNLNETIGKNEYIKEKKIRIKSDIDELSAKEIIIWCNVRNIDYKKVLSMIRIYKDLTTKIVTDNEIFDWFRENIKINKSELKEENIIKCFLYGFTENIGIYNNGKILHIISKEKYNLKYIYPGSSITDTTIIPIKFLFYLTKSKDNCPINLNNIDIKWLFEIIPDIINTKNIFITSNYDYSYYIDIINQFNISYFDNMKQNNSTDKNNLEEYFNECAKLFIQ
jgi:hypothetical protein